MMALHRLIWLGLLLACGACMASERSAWADSERSVEALLLHRRIDLRGLRQYHPATRSWGPLGPPRAKVWVINLWSIACLPCKKEFPLFRRMVQSWQGRSDVQFLFVADPPDETSPSDVEQFWKTPVFEIKPGEPCSGISSRREGVPSCVVELPLVDPAHSSDKRMLKSLFDVTMRPLTLWVDRTGLIRQVFAGSIEARKGELSESITRLAGAL